MKTERESNSEATVLLGILTVIGALIGALLSVAIRTFLGLPV